MAERCPRELVLSGYYGFGNVGDDALFEALVPALRGLGVETFYVPAGSPGKLAPFDGVVPLARNDLQAIFARLRAGAALFSGGGGLLQDATSGRSLLYYLGMMALAHAAQRPYAVGCQSIGPLRRGWARWATAWFARRAAALTVRDAASAETLRSLGMAAETVTVAADPAFLLEAPTVERDGLGLCLRRTAHTARVVGAVEAWRPRGRALRLLACHAADHELHESLDLGECVLPGGVSAMLAAVAGCEVVVSERLHPLIFAALAGVPAVAIDYDPKVAGLAADLGLPVAGRDSDLTADGLAAAVASVEARVGEPERLRACAAAARERVRAALTQVCAALALDTDNSDVR